MDVDVVAVPRSRSVILAAVQDETAGGAMLSLVAEDGARFRFPADRALARVRVADDGRGAVDGGGGDGGDGPEAALRRLRERLTPFADWLPLHATLAAGETLSIEDVARRTGLAGGPGVLCVALGALQAEPWFRRDGAMLHAVPTRDALLGLYRVHEAAFASAGEAALRAWWTQRADGVPAAWEEPGGEAAAQARVVLERARFFEPDYAPDEDVAAAAALAALAAWALAGDGSDAPDACRGRELARGLGLPDDPDHVLEQLVASGVLPPDVEPAPQRAGLAQPLDEAALAVAGRLAAEPRGAGRLDLTHEFAVAVDDADTREVDDALTLRRDADGWELLVHIADVAGAVLPGTALDDAVRARGSSLFLPDRSVLMFPPELVVGRLSLAVGEAREALTGVFRVAADGRVVASRFVRSLVRLTRRVTYEETRDPAALGPDADAGRALLRLADTLRAGRERAGARILRLPSLKVAVEDGVPRVSLRLQDTPGDVVVTEAMVLHNTQAGELLAASGGGALFRGQAAEPPAGRAMPEPADALYALRIRRTFAPTETSLDPLCHAGLGAPVYAQCTSPMRRYADLVNQRQLAAAASGETPPHSREELRELVPFLHDRERRVRQAATSRVHYWTARAIESGGGTVLRGVLSKAPRRGLGSVWVPELCRELPLRAPREWRAPAEGTAADWRIAAVQPYRGRIELAPRAPAPHTVE